MLPISCLTLEEAASLRGLLFDLDDTLLDHGKLSAEAYASLAALRAAGFELYVVTGRPLGWVEVLVRLWPIQGGVSENGGVLVLSQGASVQVVDSVGERERRARQERLRALREVMARELPELVPANDVSARRSDFTFDIGETRKVDPAVVQRARALAERHGACTLVSSVHLHISFDRTDKAAGALRLLSGERGVDASAALVRYAFIGDSENDAACFAAFRTTIGVANLRGRPTVAPRFMTSKARGQGFAEAAGELVKLRAEALNSRAAP